MDLLISHRRFQRYGAEAVTRSLRAFLGSTSARTWKPSSPVVRTYEIQHGETCSHHGKLAILVLEARLRAAKVPQLGDLEKASNG